MPMSGQGEAGKDVARRFPAGRFNVDVQHNGDAVLWDGEDMDSILIPRDHLVTVFTQLCAAHVFIGRLPR